MILYWKSDPLVEQPLPENVIPIRPRAAPAVEDIVAADADWNSRVDELKKQSDETSAVFETVMSTLKKARKRRTPAIIKEVK